MAVLHSYYCPDCDREEHDRWSDDVPACCGAEMRVLISRVNSFEWGSPKVIPHLRDEPFADRAELKSYCEQKGLELSPSADKDHGARNDMYDNAGKIFSYKGASSRQNQLYSDGARRSG